MNCLRRNSLTGMRRSSLTAGSLGIGAPGSLGISAPVPNAARRCSLTGGNLSTSAPLMNAAGRSSARRSSLLAKEGSLLTAERTGIITAERTGVLAPAVERGYKSNKPRGRAHCQQLDLALHSQTKKLNILLLSNKFNSLSQRVSLELEQQGHTTHVSEPAGELDMIETAKKVEPDMIICPFLTKRIPEQLWSNDRVPCLVVHPGIEGDRGKHSLDWALHQNSSQWGVTVLEPSDEMDAGDIWSTKRFKVQRDDLDTLTKSSLYANEVTDAATSAVLEAVENFTLGVNPRPLDYSNPVVKGRLMPKMTKEDRYVNWEESAESIALKIRTSDSQPGAVAKFLINDGTLVSTDEYRVFGVHTEEGQLLRMKGKPGQILAQRHGAILVKCGVGAVWINQLKKNKIKLCADLHLPTERTCAPVLPDPALEIPHDTNPNTYQDIWYTVNDGVCYLHFDFYNGAMNTQQCRRLVKAMNVLRSDDRFSVICLMGGHNFFSNGIHLNVIEHSSDSELESWKNINAINDVVKSIFSMNNKITISALQGNAGAGGCMMALASDMVWARKGTVLNPHYTSMHLFGSEYHTYFLEDRIGKELSDHLAETAKPVLTDNGLTMGMVDEVLPGSVAEFRDRVEEGARKISRMRVLGDILCKKDEERTASWMEELERHRNMELEQMKKNFHSPSYHEARSKFVYH